MDAVHLGGKTADDIFRKGTAFIQVVVMLEGAGTLELKNIKFEEIP
jgi:hypothetical protein